MADFTYPEISVAAPVGGATSANQVLQIAQETAIAASVSSVDTKTPTVGQKVMAASSPVVIASDQLPVPVSGPLTDTQLRATAVPVSGPLTDAQLRATPVPVSGTVSTGGLTDAQLRATPVPVSGTVSTGGLTNAELRASAIDVNIASGISNPLPVSGTVTANAGTNLNTSALNLEATQSGFKSANHTDLLAINSTLGSPFQAGGSIGNTAFIANAGTNLNTSALSLQSTQSAFSAKSASAFINVPFDETVISYVGATTKIDTVIYKLSGSTVNTLTMSYDGSDRLTGVVKS